MGWYEPFDVPEDLQRHLLCSWTASPSGTHLLVPDGCVDIVCIHDGPAWVCGPEQHAWRFALPPGTSATGARFRPGVASLSLDLDVSSIADRRVRLGDVVGHRLEQQLSETLTHAPTAAARRGAVEQFVRHRSLRSDERSEELAFLDRVLTLLVAAPRTTQHQLAALLGLTGRQLHRRALRRFGYGISVLARLLRFQRFLALAESAQPRRSTIAELAARAGYSDHAHLVRDCRAITGHTPTSFLDDYFPTFPDMSDPYKTGGRFAVSVAT